MLAIRSLRHLSAVAMLAATLTAQPSPAQRPPFRFHYAAKIICGTSREVLRGAVPQLYWTVINIHNPADSVAEFQKSLVVTLPPGRQQPERPRVISGDSLGPNLALASDCTDLRIRNPKLPAFFDGFVLIDSNVSLDVVAVYTVPGGVDVEQVAERVR